MPLVTIDVNNVGLTPGPHDYVSFIAPNVREAQGGGLISTREEKVHLEEGLGEVTLDPGPVLVRLMCGGVLDTKDKLGIVPDTGPVTLEEVLEGAFTYTPPVVDRILEIINGVVDSIKWVRRALVTGENLNSVVDNGLYNAPTSTLSATITNKPPAANNNPFTLEVQEISRTNQVLLQIFTQGTTGDVRQWVRYRLGDTWQPWSQSIFSTSEQSDWRWVKAPLTASEDLNSLTGEGMRHAETYAVGNSILNTPAGSTGQPFSVEVRALSTTNGIRHQIFTQGTGGTLSQWIRYSISGVWQDWQQTITPKVSWNPSVPVYFWGDSAVDGGDTNGGWAAGENLPSRLGALVDNEVVNRGQSGRTSNDLLLRAGVWRPAFTPVGGVLPYRQYVALTGHGLALETRNSRVAYPGRLGQINGTLRYETNIGWQFYRSDAKDPGTITKPLEFVSNLSVPNGSGTHIFLMAGNDWIEPNATGPEHDLVTHVVANYVRAVESVGADPIRHVLIGGVKSRRSTQPWDASHKFVTEVNNRLKAMFPEIFVDREAWLATRALAAAGITPTADDVAKMAAGIAPPSVFAAGDDTHVRKEVVEAEARELWAPALTRKGWATLKSGVTITPWSQPAFGGYATRESVDDADQALGQRITITESAQRPGYLGSAEDLDTVLVPKRYYSVSSTITGNPELNYPPGAFHGYLDVVTLGASYTSQTWTETNGGRQATRQRYGDSWRPWKWVGSVEAAEATAPVIREVNKINNQLDGVAFGKHRPDAWMTPGMDITWQSPNGAEVIPRTYLGDGYVGKLGAYTGYTTMRVKKAEAMGTIDVSCINPSENRHVTYRIQGPNTPGYAYLDDMQIIEEIWVGAVTDGIPQMDKLVSPRSNMEFAFQLVNEDVNAWVPTHGTATAFAAQPSTLTDSAGTAIDTGSMSIGAHIDGVNGVKLRQRLYGRHPDTGAKNWVELDVVTTISPDGMLQSEVEWTALHDLTLGSNYGPMTMVSIGEVNRFHVLGGGSYTMPTVTPDSTTYQTIGEGKSFTSGLFTSPGSLFVAVSILDPANMWVAGRSFETTSATPLRMESRNSGMLKLYPGPMQSGVTIPAGTVWKKGAQWRYGETSNPSQHI